MAFKSQVLENQLDKRFYYEPILAGHPHEETDISIEFLGRKLLVPIWVSSMTGGTELAMTINTNLAKACGEYGMGMGLGSCRALLESNERLSDFAMRKYMQDQPLYANLGIAQIEQLIDSGKSNLIPELVKKLEADGLIIHINPLQEWLQPEGDTYHSSPLDLIKKVIDKYPDLNIIVKEVGQGMGPKSLSALYQLPIQAVDFAAGGGTNFAKLELHRSTEEYSASYGGLAQVGHSANEMVELTNRVFSDLGDKVQCNETIISGGIKDYLDGYYSTEKLDGKAVYGQASGFLKHAMKDYETLQEHVESQIKGLKMANNFLTIR